MTEPRAAAPAPAAWVALELTDEQRRMVFEHTGQDGAVLFMSVEEVASRKFFAPADGRDTPGAREPPLPPASP